MPINAADTPIYHITDVSNLSAIMASGGLRSDAAMVGQSHAVIGYDHIKLRRLREIRVLCRNNRFVGEFVPFYFCPRSPMLFSINKGNPGRPVGCQASIVHLVSTVSTACTLGSEWAISDGNAGAFYASFYPDLFHSDLSTSLAALDWEAIRSTDWRERQGKKMAEFLFPDFYPWSAFHRIGCFDSAVAARVRELLRGQPHQPEVTVEKFWYY